MKYLLDTHTLLWYLYGSKKLPERIRILLEDNKEQHFVSVVTLWEIAIKMSIGKFDFEGGFTAFLSLIKYNGFIKLPIENKHLETVLTLPFYHKDPFDRLLITTAMVENMTLITVDENIHKYNVSWIW